MTFSSFLSYLRAFFPRLPMIHWMVIAGVSLAVLVFLLIRKKYSVYGSIVLAITIFYGLFLLDDLLLCRLAEDYIRPYGFDLKAEYYRFIDDVVEHRILMLFNVAIFIPYGFFLSEFGASAKRFSAGRRLWLATLAGFGLSLCIESLQLLLRVGFFELTDLVMNTLGAFVGAGLAVVGRKVWERGREKL